jgi:hypothetical protein
MRRSLLTLLWTVIFFILPVFFFGALIGLFYLKTPDPPTRMAFGGTMCFSPICGIVGLVLGIRGELPGTKKRTE